MQQLATRFHDLFRGLPRAYGTYRTNGETSDSGKAKGDAYTVNGEVTTELWEQHLSGKQRLGIVPITDDTIVYFGAIDVDDYTLDLNVIETRVRKAGLPLVPCRSKSGGVHLYLFADGVPAKLLVDSLVKWSSALGFPGVEIFPKQIKLANDKDVGNWINMPYFDAETSTTYAIYQSQALTAADFLAQAEGQRLTADELATVQIHGVDLPEGTPPCLTAIALNGAPEGTRNNAMFAFGVLAQKIAVATEGDADTLLSEFNDKYMDPPLPPVEVIGVMKSIRKKDYFYPCDNAPLSHYCDKRACRRCAFGIGDGGAGEPGVMVEQVTKVLTDPPTWIFRIDGINVELDTNDFLQQMRFKRKVAEKLNRIPASLKQTKWEAFVNTLLANVHEEEAPEDASSQGQFLTHLRDFCLRQSRGTTEESLATNGLYYEEESHRIFFRSTYLEKYLEQQKFRELSGKGVWSALRKVEGVKHGQSNIKGRNIQWWSIPAPDDEADDFTPPQAQQEEF
jgi:hypothetical protein